MLPTKFTWLTAIYIFRPIIILMYSTRALFRVLIISAYRNRQGTKRGKQRKMNFCALVGERGDKGFGIFKKQQDDCFKLPQGKILFSQKKKEKKRNETKKKI